MTFRTTAVCCFATAIVTLGAASFAQQPPYDVFPSVEPPCYRVRHEGSAQPGELKFAANYTIWIPGDQRQSLCPRHGSVSGQRLPITPRCQPPW